MLLTPEEFEHCLALAYTREPSAAETIVDDMGESVDLAKLTEQLPEVADLLEAENDAPIIRLINALLTQAVREGASDIHIEIFESRALVRFRVDGTLRDVVEPRRGLHPAMVSRIKVMASLDIAEKRLPQDGRIALRIAGRPIDVRVSTIPTGHGERVVLRLLDKQAGRLTLDALGMAAPTRDAHRRADPRAARHLPRDRADGLGQDHDALLRALAPRPQDAQHPHRRGPDRVRAGRRRARPR